MISNGIVTKFLFHYTNIIILKLNKYMNNDLITLANRSLVKVSGNDSENFLQSIITIDLSGKDRELLSSCF